MTQPVELPLYGTLKHTSYSKEQLIELWQELIHRFELPIRSNTQFTGIEPGPQSTYIVKTENGETRARHVCLALGRGGSPRKLGVPGEDLPKVAYNLIDAQSYQCRRILVVGGGDSAIESALGLAEQPGNKVTLSYRQAAFSRLKARNDSRIREALQTGQLECLFESQVQEIGPDAVRMNVAGQGGTECRVLPNDEVFIMIGGVPPFELLQAAGVSFDPSRRTPPPALVDQGTGLLRALSFALVLSLIAWVWIHTFESYYRLPVVERPDSRFHDSERLVAESQLPADKDREDAATAALVVYWAEFRSSLIAVPLDATGTIAKAAFPNAARYVAAFGDSAPWANLDRRSLNETLHALGAEVRLRWRTERRSTRVRHIVDKARFRLGKSEGALVVNGDDGDTLSVPSRHARRACSRGE